jgi:peptidoglycan/LPS O-acetylase OafA/YrhL
MDGLRGILAVYVMLGHVLPFTVVPGWAASPFHHGEAAVDLFFSLSGLVIGNSLERFGGAFWPFMRARARRLLPVYFLVLAATVLLLLAGDPLRAMPWVGAAGWAFWSPGFPPQFMWHVAAHALLVQGIIPQSWLPYAYVTLLGPAWSLSTEWQFYVLIGLLAPKRLSRFALALLVAGAVYHLFWPVGWWQFSRAFLPDAAPFFALGLASAVYLRGHSTWMFWVCLCGACAVGLAQGVDKALVPLAWGVAMLAQRRAWGGILEHQYVLYLGAISYPLYLVNEPVSRALALAVAPWVDGNGLAFTLIWLPLAMAGALGVAAALHHGIELRFMRSGKKFFPSVIAAAAPR